MFSCRAAYDEASAPNDAMQPAGKKLQATAVDRLTVVISIPEPFGQGLHILGNLPMLPKHKLAGALEPRDFRDDERHRFRDGAAGRVRDAGASPRAGAGAGRPHSIPPTCGQLRRRRCAVHCARVRAIVRSERQLDYAVAARALGSSDFRVLGRRLLPAACGFIMVEITTLGPAFIVAEVTLSHVGLGFPEPVASWGAMLHDASNVRVFADFPWLLIPAVAMFPAVLGLNLLLQDSRPEGLPYERLLCGVPVVQTGCGTRSESR